jgi:hypothetical protein
MRHAHLRVPREVMRSDPDLLLNYCSAVYGATIGRGPDHIPRCSLICLFFGNKLDIHANPSSQIRTGI